MVSRPGQLAQPAEDVKHPIRHLQAHRHEGRRDPGRICLAEFVRGLLEDRRLCLHACRLCVR